MTTENAVSNITRGEREMIRNNRPETHIGGNAPRSRRLFHTAILSVTIAIIAPLSAVAQFNWPNTGRVSSNYDSPRPYGKHAAIDIASGTWDHPPIWAGYYGTVTYTRISGSLTTGYGRLVKIAHLNGYETRYAHNESFATFEGAQVMQDQLIAYEGSTGNSSGPHCHYEIRRWDTKLYISATLDSWLTRGTWVPNGYADVYRVYGDIKKKYDQLGGHVSALGWAVTNELGTPDGIGRFNHFQHGSIYWTQDTGAHEVRGDIRQKWADLGWETSPLRYPTTDELGTPDGVGRFNHFQRGSIYWTPDTGAHYVLGAIRKKWADLGWETGFLRYPTTDELGTPDGVGRFNHFQGGSIYWTSGTGAWSVQGAIRKKWADMGWERSCLGYPISDEFSWNGGRRSNFQGGYIFWTSTDGAKASCQ